MSARKWKRRAAAAEDRVEDMTLLLEQVREWLVYRGYATRRTPLEDLPACAEAVYPRWHVAWLTANLTRLGYAKMALIGQAKRQTRRAEEAERHVRVLLDPGVEWQWRSILGQSRQTSEENEELHRRVRTLEAVAASNRRATVYLAADHVTFTTAMETIMEQHKAITSGSLTICDACSPRRRDGATRYALTPHPCPTWTTAEQAIKDTR